MLWATATVVVGVLVVAEAQAMQRLRWVAKIMASALFVVQGVVSLGGVVDDVAVGLLVALMLSALGDVCLLVRDRRAFAAGLVAFLLAHVAFAVVFALLNPAWPVAIGVGLTLTALGLSVVWSMRVGAGPMAPAAAGYAVAIAGMVGLACGIGVRGSTPSVLVCVGAVAFFVSDLFVARQRFGRASLVNKALGLPLYYAAQFALATGIPAVGG